MQGPSELGIAARATLTGWSRIDALASVEVPALVVAVGHDTTDPAHMADVAARLPNGGYHFCPTGSHLAMYDDQHTYFAGLVDFLKELEAS